MIDYADIVNRYKQVRRIGTALNNHLVKLLDKDAIQEGGRRLGMLQNGVLVFDSEDESAVLMDYCIHHVLRDRQNTLERYLADSPPPPGSPEMMVAQAAAQSRYSIFQVRKVIPGVGVEVLDVFCQDRALVADLGFSQTAVVGVAMASRLIPLGDSWMTGGAVLAVYGEAIDKIERGLSRFVGSGSLEYDALSPERKAEFVAIIVRACLEAPDKPQHIYQDPDHPIAMESPVPIAQLERTSRVGRNDPCPCGSGKKYKKCCGR